MQGATQLRVERKRGDRDDLQPSGPSGSPRRVSHGAAGSTSAAAGGGGDPQRRLTQADPARMPSDAQTNICSCFRRLPRTTSERQH